MQEKKNILQLSLIELESWLVEHGDKAYRAKQIFNWIYIKNQMNPALFSNLSQNLRHALAEEFSWNEPIIDSILSSDDGSEKILLKFLDGHFSECVLMPNDDRVTLCVSSQIGCRMACTFCQTGKMGFTRNLTSGEIIYQLVLANKRLIERNITERRVTNVVFMGMGEPLDNYDAVVEACQFFIDPVFFGLSKHKVTISTSGLVPAIKKLGYDTPVSLAISLHSADSVQRSSMMPINKTYPLTDLKEALLKYPVQTRHGITFEYLMIKDLNDSITHARKLVRFLHGLKAKVNLIPMNPHPGAESMLAADAETMRAFQNYLSIRSIPAPIRYSRGQDVSAACGQLAAKREEELNQSPRKTSLARRREYLDEKNQE